MVGLCVERSPEMVVGLLGILKAGGAYLPLDPNYPRERLAFMLADAGAAVLVTQAGAARPAARAAPHRAPRRAARRRLAGDRAQPGTAPPLASTRATRPMSSTPRAQPEHPRASSSSMQALPIKIADAGPEFGACARFSHCCYFSFVRFRSFD